MVDIATDLDDDLDVLGAGSSGSASVRRSGDGKYVIPENAPVLPSIVSGGRDAELLVNAEGYAAVLYDQPLPEKIEWVEYDMDLALLTFVTYDGKVQGLGMKIHKPFRRYLSKAKEIVLIYMEDSEYPAGFVPVKLVVRNTGI